MPYSRGTFLWLIIMHDLGFYYVLDFSCLMFLITALHLTADR